MDVGDTRLPVARYYIQDAQWFPIRISNGDVNNFGDAPVGMVTPFVGGGKGWMTSAANFAAIQQPFVVSSIDLRLRFPIFRTKLIQDDFQGQGPWQRAVFGTRQAHLFGETIQQTNENEKNVIVQVQSDTDFNPALDRSLPVSIFITQQ